MLSFHLFSIFVLSPSSLIPFFLSFFPPNGLLRSWANSSPCFHLLLFLLLPSFIQNTSLSLVSQLPSIRIPPPPPVLTSPLVFRRCRPPWSLRSLSSSFHLYQIPLLHCLPMPLLHSSQVCVCVSGVRSTHTFIGCSPFIHGDTAGWWGQGGRKWNPSCGRRCIALYTLHRREIKAISRLNLLRHRTKVLLCERSIRKAPRNVHLNIWWLWLNCGLQGCASLQYLMMIHCTTV